MSSKVKQANFRLPLEYMALIDDFARREDITKATVITRALDCMQASYDSGHGGMPVTGGGSGGGASEAELEDLRAKLKRAEERATEAERALQSAEDRAKNAIRERDAAEARARDAAQASSQNATIVSNDGRRNEEAEAEIERLRTLVAKQAATLEEKIRALATKEVGYDDQVRSLASKDAEISSRDALIADRDRQISDLRNQLSEANARAQFAGSMPTGIQPVNFDTTALAEGNPAGAIGMLNMLNSVMAAFKQQVKDARVLGEQEGRKALQHEFEDVINKARNDGYRDAMTYLDDRATTARENGAREERARIANMGFFERRRYLNIHVA